LSTLIISTTTIVSHTFARSSYGLLLPAIEDSLNISHARAGFGGTVVFLAFLPATLLVAGLASRTEPINLMRAGLAVAAVGLGLNALAPSYPVLLIGLALGGAAGAGIWVPAPTVATAGVAPERRGLVIGLLTATIGVGILVVGVGTNLLRSAMNDQGLWRPIWAIEAGVAFLLFVALVGFVRPEPTPKVSGGINLNHLKSVPGWRQITVAYALYAIAGGGFFSFVVAALEQDGGLDRSHTTAVFAVMGLVGAVFAPLTGLLSDRVGRKPVMLGSVAIVGSAAAAIASGAVIAVVGGAILFGAIASSFPTQVAAYVRDHADARVFSGAFATMLLFFSVTAISAPSMMGVLADLTGSFAIPYLTLAGVSLLIIATVATLPSSASQSPTPSLPASSSPES